MTPDEMAWCDQRSRNGFWCGVAIGSLLMAVVQVLLYLFNEGKR